MNPENGNKRQRSSNYTPEERKWLIQLASKYAYILENKKTDTITWKEKESVWLKIGEEFNTKSPSAIYRSTDSLKKYYENQKKILRKEAAQERMEILKTGGGPPVPMKTSDDSTETLRSIINKKTVSGLKNPFDQDFIFEVVDNEKENKNIIPEDPLSFENEVIDGEASLDWGNYTPNYLKTPLHKDLNAAIKNNASNNVANNSDNLKTPSSKKASNTNWVNRRRPVISSLTTSNISNDYSELAKIKTEWIKLQIEISKDQLECAKNEAKLRIKNLELENQIKKLQLHLLQKQI